MNINMILSVCTGLILCLAVALILLCMTCKTRERKLLKRLQNMLDEVIAGSFREGRLEDTGLSELESAMWRFLNDCRVSSDSLKEQERKMQSLISDISHQTVTPISNIKIYAELIKEQREKWKAGDYDAWEDISEEIDVIADQADKLDFLIESLVKLSRLENGILELEPGKLSIRHVLSALDRQFSRKAQQKNISFRIEDCSEEAVFDLKWTVEAVGNIVDNAIKYTPEGGKVTIRISPCSLFLRLDVTDTGIGIAKEEQASVFSRFYRSRAVRRQPGVGIGLYFAREVMKRQKAYIKLSSEPEKGAVFSVFLYRG